MPPYRPPSVYYPDNHDPRIGTNAVIDETTRASDVIRERAPFMSFGAIRDLYEDMVRIRTISPNLGIPTANVP